MVTNLSPSSEAFMANIDRVQRKVEDATRQVSSGKRVNVASDAPNEVDTILQLHTDEVRNAQIQENLGWPRPMPTPPTEHLRPPPS